MVLGALILKYSPAKRANFKKREVKATSILTSCASDLDLIADWLFFANVWNSDEDKGVAGWNTSYDVYSGNFDVDATHHRRKDFIQMACEAQH